MIDKDNLTSNDFADYWRNSIGVNVIPANTSTKKPKVSWKQWQTDSIPEDLHKEWKSKNLFNDGMAIICGQVFHNDSKKDWWLNGIDCDNLLGLNEFCVNDIERVAKDTLVEQHSNKEKCHIYFYTKEPIQSQAPLSGKNIPQIEIKSGGKFLLYCAGGVHKDGSMIDILDCKEPALVGKEQLEEKIDDIFTNYGLTYLKKVSTLKPLYERDIKIKLRKGDNRGQHILSYVDSKKIRNPELDEDDLFYLARKYEKENCVDIYDDKKIKDLVNQAMGYGEQHPLQENKTIKFNDDDQVKKFIRNFIGKYDIVTPFNTNDIYFRDGVIHKLGIDGILKQEIKGMIIKNRDFNDLKFNIGIESQVSANELNPFDNDLIGLSNVVLNPNTFEPITNIVYVNSVLDREYRPELRGIEDKILVAIKEILGDLYDKFLAICVILLTGKNNIKKMPIFDGAPDSGKTTLLEMLEMFLGKFTSIHIRKLQEDTRTLAKCTERLNVTDEAENCILDEDLFKGIIDGSVQQQSWKYEKELTTYDPSKVLHVGASNGIPDIRGEAGVAKRIERIPCPNHFEKNDEWKKALLTKDNFDRFLLTVIDYAKTDVKNPLLDMSTSDKTDLFEMMGDPVGHFKENNMYENNGEYCLVKDAYDAFNKFRKENNIYKECTMQKFAKILGIGSKSKRVDRISVKVYEGWNLVGKSHTHETL